MIHRRVKQRIVPGLAERLRTLREAQGLSQQVLATRAGISIPRLGSAERFDAATTETLTLLARALKVSVDDLVGRPTSETRDGLTLTAANPGKPPDVI